MTSSDAGHTDNRQKSLSATKGMVFDIQRFCIHDGPGIRTTVFMKGCPLGCPWCHNPESISQRPVISFDSKRCISCGACQNICQYSAMGWNYGQPEIDRNKCKACGQCTEKCPTAALEQIGHQQDTGQIMDIVQRDMQFYKDSGGGMTLSGGEPASQANFTLSLLELARKKGIHTCIETCGVGQKQHFEKFADFCDLFIIDIKATPENYAKLTGVHFERTLETLTYLYNKGCRLWLRFPVIGKLNDSDKRLDHIISLKQKFPDIKRFELVKFHVLWLEKAKWLGFTTSELDQKNVPDEKLMQRWQKFI